jgi:glutamine synthetase adenylyltransferase
MPQTAVRVNAQDDPRRCHGTTKTGQCWNQVIDGGTLCPDCINDGGKLVEANRRQYLLTDPRYQTRLAELSTADEIKSLRDEVAIARMLVEERLNKIKSDQDLYTACGSINSLLLTIEKLVSRSHILEQNLGLLYHKSTILQMMQAFVAIVDEEVRHLDGGVAAIDRIVERIYLCARNTRNAEQARGMKLLPKAE